jgi:hypothetical protein
MSQYAIHPPIIALKRLDEPPFEVELGELGWFSFVGPELGQRSWSTAYEYPGPKLWVRREHIVRRRAWIHNVECLEVQNLDYDAEGDRVWECTVLRKVERGYIRCYAAFYGDEKSVWIKTWKDNSFGKEWEYDPGYPIRIVDVGKWRLLDDQHFTDGDPGLTPSHASPNGVGLWEVHIGECVHHCLRVLEPEDSAEGIMVEAFVDRHGRTMLCRRYNGSRWSYGSKRTLVDGKPHEWSELLPDAPRLYYNDICFVLWDFSIPDIALSSNRP